MQAYWRDRTLAMTVQFLLPINWIRYDLNRVVGPLTDAKAAVLSLTTVPYQRSWAERLQEAQLKSEVAGTSRIEGAEFTESELDDALSSVTAEEAMTRSQRQARAAVNTYRWIANLEKDRPITGDLVREIHRRIVTGCDDDHCEPGRLRSGGQNVVFGNPRHRGVEGGKECERAFDSLCDALQQEFRNHDVLIQALALHYHLGAMHPFLDGNGRTARALEALMLQRAGLRDALFIALSNYYYDEKTRYLSILSLVRQSDGDLTEFLVFGLNGIAFQCRRLLTEITKNISKSLFRDIAGELFGRLMSAKKRVIAKRQMAILHYLLDNGPTEAFTLMKKIADYNDLGEPWSAFVRDINALQQLRAIWLRPQQPTEGRSETKIIADVRLEWPTEITETKFFESTRTMPKAKTLTTAGWNH